ncbi:MAG: xylulokinase [Verrucomicrobiales bacterium]|jgi:xylulokinase
MYTIGIDSGTQSTKAIVVELETGAIVAQAQEKYDVLPGLPSGHMEQEPKTWIDAVDSTVASCLDQIGEKRSEVKGIGVSGQQHGLVVLDAEDRPVRPAKLWCDTSTAAECAEFEKAFGGINGLIERAGNAIPPGFTAPKILWLKRNEPDHFAATRSVLLPHDYINFYLTGIKRMEFGDASGTGLLDVRNRKWDEELVNFIDPRLAEMLPELGSSNEPHGTLREELRQRWELPEGVLVSAGGGDNMMGAIGTGNLEEGIVTASLGTSGTVFACSEKPIVDPEGEIAAFCDSTDRWMPLMCTMNVTVLTEQTRKLFGWELEQLEEHVTASEPGAGGLTFLPYLTGERTPNLPDGSGVLHGINTTNMTPANIARAAMEGVTIGLAYGLDRLRELGLTVSEIRMIGGGSKSPAWRQIAADVFGVPVVCLSTAEGASLGGAIQAAHCVVKASGEKADYAALSEKLVQLDESTRCLPRSEFADLYAEKLSKQMSLTRSMHGSGHL